MQTFVKKAKLRNSRGLPFIKHSRARMNTIRKARARNKQARKSRREQR